MENMYTKESFNSVFHDCDTLVSEEYEAEQKSGSAHVGMSALVDFIARKPIETALFQAQSNRRSY